MNLNLSKLLAENRLVEKIVEKGGGTKWTRPTPATPPLPACKIGQAGIVLFLVAKFFAA